MWGNGKQHFIGSFDKEVEAARAYDRAVLRFRGQVGGRAARAAPPAKLTGALQLQCLGAAAPALLRARTGDALGCSD